MAEVVAQEKVGLQSWRDRIGADRLLGRADEDEMAHKKGTPVVMQNGQVLAFTSPHRAAFDDYRAAVDYHPLFLRGDALTVLDELSPDSIDCAMTSPPYWGQRSYSGGGIGLEDRYEDYIAHLLAVFGNLQRVLKRTGSFWLNIGDA